VCQALASEEVQQESTRAATMDMTSFAEELHLDEVKEDAGIGYKMLSKNYKILKKYFC